MIGLAAFTQKAQAMPFPKLAADPPDRFTGREVQLKIFSLCAQQALPRDAPPDAFRISCDDTAHRMVATLERMLAGQERTVKRENSETFTAPATWFDHLLHDLGQRPQWGWLTRRLRAARYTTYTVTATVEVDIKKVFPDMRIPYRSVDIVTVLETPERLLERFG